MKSPNLWDHIVKGCQHLPVLGQADVSGLSHCGHCWPTFKGISQSQPHLHPWGPTPLILYRILSITTSWLLKVVNRLVCPLWMSMMFVLLFLPLKLKALKMLAQMPGSPSSTQLSVWPFSHTLCLNWQTIHSKTLPMTTRYQSIPKHTVYYMLSYCI